VDAGAVASEGGAIRLRSHQLGLDARDQRLWDQIAPLLSEEERFRPPRAGEIAPLVKAPEAEVRRLLKALARRRDVIEIAPDHFFRRETMEEVADIAADIAGAQPDGLFSAAQLRDRLNNGRKVAIKMLEYFDRRGLTLRRGDLRLINPARQVLFARAR
jgi:selenocysteine-specific elongation factor